MKNQIVYLSEKLRERYPDSCKRLTQILEKNTVDYSFLKGTEDIWCRDYMPVQNASGQLIQFDYNPSYLQEKEEWRKTRSDVEKVCRLNGLHPKNSNIILDGGNVLICDNRAIISKRVFKENPNKNEKVLIHELEELLECEVIIIPDIKYDMTGHADGMVRFINRNTILGNNLAGELKYWREGMQKVIEKYELKYVDMPFFEPKDRKHPLSAIGVYVNYLEVNNLIVFPIFGRDEDNKALEVIKSVFPDRVIEDINYNDVALEGGLLNCTTWVRTI